MSGNNNKPPSPETYHRLIEALRQHRIAAVAAREVGVSTSYAWLLAKKENIQLISQSDHAKRLQADPNFQAKLHSPEATEARRKAVKLLYAKRRFRKELADAARIYVKKVKQDPAFCKTASLRLKKALTDPAFQQKLLETETRANQIKRQKRD
jgi:hypothetical protein